MIRYADIPGITIYPIPPERRESLRFEIQPPLPRPVSEGEEIDRVWSELTRANPRLFDGPALLADPVTAALDHLVARSATYRSLAAADRLGLHVRAIGVQALVSGTDEHGQSHLLLARRGPQVRMYPGLWENAPSGTVRPPPHGAHAIGADHFVRSLVEEGAEELGMNFAESQCVPVALLEDAAASSLDVVLGLELVPFRIPAGLRKGASDRWEYTQWEWVAESDMGSWVNRGGSTISPPTLALLRWAEWIEPQPRAA